MRSNASSAGTMNEEWTHNGKGVVINEQRAGIGKSIVINGELSGGEDLTIEGTVEGKIELRDHVLTVGSNGRIKAEVAAKSFVVFGQVVGNLTATEKVDSWRDASPSATGAWTPCCAGISSTISVRRLVVSWPRS